MIARLFKSYVRLKFIALATRFLLGKKIGVKGTKKAMFFSFVLEEIVNRILTAKKAGKPDIHRSSKKK